MISDICLVSLNDISREGLRRILTADGFNVKLSTADIEEALASNFIGEILFLLDLPGNQLRLEAVRKISEKFSSAKTAVLVNDFQMQDLGELFAAGVDGYIVQSASSAPLLAAFRLVALGKKALPSELAEVLSGHNFERTSPTRDIGYELELARLSSRERDVLYCLMGGNSNKVIARELDVCEATVKVHVKAILRKLEVNNRTQAAMWASARGLAQPHSAVPEDAMVKKAS
jgi:two-component system nitrate/nitrite response regulator NarL